jgi:hypothetical protein
VLQREKQQEQLQQQLQQREQRKAGGCDTERARDIKRSKVGQDDKQHQVELDAARKKEEEAKDDAAKVQTAACIRQLSDCVLAGAVGSREACVVAVAMQAMSSVSSGGMVCALLLALATTSSK